ncbi:MAG: glycosyltransferase family 4 protein [Methanomassiliicoccales archaeon]|jgi:glycosyltransferase involved in cell wall biosynthesis|nr:glycosyltransferase family 4 protein [Methanomassiliicoccales archaeon]
METRKILMVSTFYPPFHIGGDAVHVKYLAEELAKRGHEVHVLHSIDAYAFKQGRIRERHQGDLVHLHSIQTNYPVISTVATYLTGRNGAVERTLRHIMTEIDPEWVHFHNISLLGYKILTIPNKMKIYTAHDHWLICQRNDLMNAGRFICEKASCMKCSAKSLRPYQFWRDQEYRNALTKIDIILAPSRYMGGVLKKHMGIDPTVLPNFAPRNTCRTSEISDGAPFFLFASVLEKHKGLHLLLECFCGGGLDSDLHVAGKGHLEKLVLRKASETKGRVKYLGYLSRSELIEELESATCFVSPSICVENSPLSCIEALSMGKPLVVSNRGGLPELVTDPECGIVCEPTVEKIKDALRRIENDEKLRSQMSANALRRYELYHTPERYLESYFRVIEELRENVT